MLSDRFDFSKLLEFERKLEEIREEIDVLKNSLQFVPNSSAPVDPAEGLVAFSNGDGGGFDGSSGAGLYVYVGGSWTKL